MEYEGEDVSSSWMILWHEEGSVNWKRKHQIAFYGELALEGAVDLS
jgi:hypothetical protein